MKHRWPYTLHPGYAMQEKMIANLKTQTGHSLEDWVEIVDETGPSDRKRTVAWLRGEYELGATTANIIAAEAFGERDVYGPEALVETQYKDRQQLVAIFEALMDMAFTLGDDITARPCKTFVPLYRRHVFAQIRPSTMSRIDFGLALGNTIVPERLISTGGNEKGDRISHRIPITSVEEVDSEVEHWLLRAYEMDAR